MAKCESAPLSCLMAATLLSFFCGAFASGLKIEKGSGSFFTEKRGCFLLYNMTTKVFDVVMNEENCRKRLPACSTLKIPLAVMAFDSGILADENQVLKWDGEKRSREVLNRNHDAKSWLNNSVVWFSIQITSQLGAKKLQKYLDTFDYGNRDISSGIEGSWLISPTEGNKPALKISAYEQVAFMKKLWADDLPTSKKASKLTREITYLETSPNGFELSGKTGSNFYDSAETIRLGWFVSHLKRDKQEYIAVTTFSDLASSIESSSGGERAKMLTKEILASLGLW
jgi:beta-lactamase class D